MAAKNQRHRTLLEIVARERIATQAELAVRLEAAGYPCTQASISRDVRELGLVKQGGAYVTPGDGGGEPLPPSERLAATVAPFIRSAQAVGEHLLVVRTVTGTANSVGLYMDQAGWAGLVGTVAGDDTIIAVTRDAAAGRAVADRLTSIRGTA